LTSRDGGSGRRAGSFSRCDPDHGIRKERSDVNSLSHLYVAAHQNEKLAAAASERLARQARSTRTNEHDLGAAFKSVWSLLSGPADGPVNLPDLTNYPYRG
jgi:hypothetical protein